LAGGRVGPIITAAMKSSTARSPTEHSPRSRWYPLASALIALHLLAVWVAPFSVPPSSPFAQMLATWFAPYLEAAFLNHGYKFFAPDPGPTHLVRYELELADGSKQTGTFPDLNRQWPRLLYHRHMMLSERLVGPPEATWIEPYARSYARHLLDKHQARKVTLYLVTHLLPYPGQVQAGMKLDDPSLYQESQLLVLSESSPQGDRP
jgi:hypothetical protein